MSSGLADNTGPNCTVRLISPKAGYYTGKDTTIGVTFSWAVDDTGEVAGYYVRVGNSADLVETMNTTDTVHDAQITTSPYYGYWQAGVADAAGNITWSEVRRIRMGYTVNDYDADGYSDILAGAPYYASGADRAWLYKGTGRAAPSQVCNWQGSAGVNLGQCLNFIGDFNGDGLADLLVGSPGYYGGYQGGVDIPRGGRSVHRVECRRCEGERRKRFLRGAVRRRYWRPGRGGTNDLAYAAPGVDAAYSEAVRIGIVWGGLTLNNAWDTYFDGSYVNEQLGGRQLSGSTFNICNYGRTIGRM